MNIILAIAITSQLVGIDTSLMLGLCHTETNWRNVNNMCDGGSPSYGVCQVKLRTAKWLFPFISKENLKNVFINSFVAATYLKRQIERYNDIKKGLSAYNAGRAVKFNKRYVKKVLKVKKAIDAMHQLEYYSFND